MKRSLLLLTLLITAGGCSTLQSINPFAQKKKEHQETLAPAAWQQLRYQNQVRLVGEDIPGAKPATRPGPNLDGAVELVELVFWRLPVRIYEFVTGNNPSKYVRMMEDDKSADLRRAGLMTMVSKYDFARTGDWVERYWQIAQGDPDYLTRAAAVRALNRSRARRGVPLFVKMLEDRNPVIRLEAAKALANIPDPGAMPALIRHTNATFDLATERVSESRDVRLACADALRNYNQAEAARTLIGILRERDFEVSWQARKSLILMTGRDFRYDQTKWREYMATAPNPFGS